MKLEWYTPPEVIFTRPKLKAAGTFIVDFIRIIRTFFDYWFKSNFRASSSNHLNLHCLIKEKGHLFNKIISIIGLNCCSYSLLCASFNNLRRKNSVLGPAASWTSKTLSWNLYPSSIKVSYLQFRDLLPRLLSFQGYKLISRLYQILILSCAYIPLAL